MKKILYLIIFCSLCGCTPYGIVGYKSSSTDIPNYYFQVGYLVNHKPKMNQLPRSCMVFYVNDKYDMSKKIEVISVQSKIYGKLEPYHNKTFTGKADNLYLKNMDWESRGETLKKIENDTIQVVLKDSNEELKTISFYNSNNYTVLDLWNKEYSFMEST